MTGLCPGELGVGGSVRPPRPGLWACHSLRAAEGRSVHPAPLSAERLLLMREGQQEMSPNLPCSGPGACWLACALQGGRLCLPAQ